MKSFSMEIRCDSELEVWKELSLITENNQSYSWKV